MANQIMAVAIVVLGLLVGIAAILGSFGEILVKVVEYLKKLFAGPVKTEPFANKSTETRKS